MKKIFFILPFVVLFGIVGCKPDDPEPDNPVIPEIDSVIPEIDSVPTFLLSSDSIVFYGNESKELLIIAQFLNHSQNVYVYGPEWVDIFPNYGYLSNGDTMEVGITSKLDSVLFRVEDELLVDSRVASKRIKLIGIPEDQLLYSMPDSLCFLMGYNDRKLSIANTGNVPFSYSISTSSTAIAVTTTGGEVPVEEQAEITVSIDRDQIDSDLHPSLFVAVNGEVTDTVALFVERKQFLASDVIDAEYSKATDLLVYVSSDVTLSVYHPATKAVEVVPLFYYPTCVSVSSDGTKAVVGHDAHVSYVDLQTASLINTHDISCNANDIVLGDNGWAYVFPTRDQWVSIHCINVTLPNASETTGGSLYAGSKGKMLPNGKFLYVVVSGISPANIKKYDIRNGTVEFMYDSPYWGDYPIGSNLWFSQNGNRLFTNAGTVFKTSESSSTDMTYNGTINFEGGTTSFRGIVWLDHLESDKKLFALSLAKDDVWHEKPNMPYVYVHNSDNLMYQKKIRLEDYYVLNHQEDMFVYPVDPYYVFANSDGHELYVLAKSHGSGLEHDWAIQTIRVEQ